MLMYCSTMKVHTLEIHVFKFDIHFGLILHMSGTVCKNLLFLCGLCVTLPFQERFSFRAIVTFDIWHFRAIPTKAVIGVTGAWTTVAGLGDFSGRNFLHHIAVLFGMCALRKIRAGAELSVF